MYRKKGKYALPAKWKRARPENFHIDRAPSHIYSRQTATASTTTLKPVTRQRPTATAILHRCCTPSPNNSNLKPATTHDTNVSPSARSDIRLCGGGEGGVCTHHQSRAPLPPVPCTETRIKRLLIRSPHFTGDPPLSLGEVVGPEKSIIRGGHRKGHPAGTRNQGFQGEQKGVGGRGWRGGGRGR